MDESNRDNPMGLTVREDTRKGVYVEGLMEEEVRDTSDFFRNLHSRLSPLPLALIGGPLLVWLRTQQHGARIWYLKFRFSWWFFLLLSVLILARGTHLLILFLQTNLLPLLGIYFFTNVISINGARHLSLFYVCILHTLPYLNVAVAARQLVSFCLFLWLTKGLLTL